MSDLPTPDLPIPDFAFDVDAPGACVAGIRPHRIGSYRLETEALPGRLLVHNYGHSGAGITLSWGCAARVQDIVAEHLPASPDRTAAVIGAGVMGLTAATRLAELGLDVSVYAERMPGATTSAKAGGQWGASTVQFSGKEEEFTAILRTAYTTFKDSIGKGFGVSERPNYDTRPSPDLEPVLHLAPGLIPERVVLDRLPFAGPPRAGFGYQTLLIEPPIFLARLETDLRAGGVVFEQRTFVVPADVLALPQGVIVNCTGLGAMTLWNDALMLPIKGQLAMLPAQPALQYLYGDSGYLFPRSDHVVIGGTWERNVTDETPDKARCAALVAHMLSAFRGTPMPVPEFHIGHPSNAAMVAGTWGAPRRA